jgi:tripartite-type tricarboxylate transporter receptor subunit TctC
VNFPNVLVVHKGVGVKTLAEFVALEKKKPGSLDYASTGPGSASHLAGELFNDRAGIEMVHVPYKGGAPALQDLLGGRIAAYFSAPPTALPHIEAGKLVPLATTGLTRPADLPNIPTGPKPATRVLRRSTGTVLWHRAKPRCRCWTAETGKS